MRTNTSLPQMWTELAESLAADSPTSAGGRPVSGIGKIFPGLQRPECVLTHASGTVFVSDRRGGVLKLLPDGQQLLTCHSGLLPNGIALLEDGGFLIANLADAGGVWKIGRDGEVSPWLTEVNGQPLHRVNFVTNDTAGRVWVCISATDGGDCYPVDTSTGYIVMCDASGARIVAEGLHYTNECRVSADGCFLYVNETFGRRLSRFALAPNGLLGSRETVATFEAGDFPDGLALDAEGGAWVVCVGSNRLYRVGADGIRHTVIDDALPETVAALEASFESATLSRPQLSAARGRRLGNITSLAFGGADLRTAYMGCIGGDSLATFRSPVAGLEPVHWNWG
jgi:sugar lactone lactonase YvrE